MRLFFRSGHVDRVFFWMILPVLVAGCAGGSEQQKTQASTTMSSNDLSTMKTPAEQFAQLEETLLTADSLSINFTVTSTGMFAAKLNGNLSISPGEKIDLHAAGTFGEQSVTLHLQADEMRMRGGNGTSNFDQERPEELREALLLGLTRMGILHNLAKLVTGAPPDHADGGVREWIQADSISSGDSSDEIAFNIIVSGTRTAAARLEIEQETGLPSKRTQSVVFPGGRMDVVELYEYGEAGE